MAEACHVGMLVIWHVGHQVPYLIYHYVWFVMSYAYRYWSLHTCRPIGYNVIILGY